MKYCWEIKNCTIQNKAQCEAYKQKIAECWMIPGTMCGGNRKDSLAAKMLECMKCDYYRGHHNYHKN